ncbi:MAG: ABC transporter permease [Lachnospiraceae bacterium]
MSTPKKPHKLTSTRLAWANLVQKRYRTLGLAAIVTVLSFTLFGGSVLSLSLQNGLQHVEERLGADLMVVPQGYEAATEEVLLKGEPNYFYFDDSILNDLAKIPGVELVSKQFFLASLSSDCCSAKVQIIGFDPASDFILQPWIESEYSQYSGSNEIIAGSDIVLEEDSSIRFFDTDYKVDAQLKKSATGLDASVFMSMDTLKSLIEKAHEKGTRFLSDTEGEGAISTVMIKLADGYDALTVAENIRESLPEVDTIVSKSMIRTISDNIEAHTIYLHTIVAIIWILSAIVLLVIFSISLQERKKEFALLRIAGATRRKLLSVLLRESLLISLAGALAGILLGAVFIIPFSTYIGDVLELPYILPQPSVLVYILLLNLLFATLIGPLASLYAALKISRPETYQTLKEGE